MCDLLDWLAVRPRTYAETMAAWTSHCPRLTTWEDALSSGLVAVERTGDGSRVVLTDAGNRARRQA